MNIGGREIGPGHPPYIVAEISGEHRGDIRKAKALIGAAADVGADAVKLQCFDPWRLAKARGGTDKVLPDGLWAGRNLLELYRETWTPIVWFGDLFEYAADVGITLFTSVFDWRDVEAVEAFSRPPHGTGSPAYKIASREAGSVLLVAHAAATGKPLIISTGTATEADLGLSVAVAAKATPNLALLYCVSEYPAPIEGIDLSEIDGLHRRYQLPVGFSDHTVGIVAAVRAVREHGAAIIEKHITSTGGDGGPDATFALEPTEFAAMVKEIRECP